VSYNKSVMYKAGFPLDEYIDIYTLVRYIHTLYHNVWNIFQASENLGCVMVFTLVSAVQEFLLQLVEDIKNEIQSEKDRAREEEMRLDELKVSTSIICEVKQTKSRT